MFATVVDDAGRPAGSGSRRLRLPLGVGLGLHAAGILAILASRAWSLEEPPEPPIPIVFYGAPAPPLGDGGDAEAPRAGEKVRDEPERVSLEQVPDEVGGEIPRDARTPSEDGTAGSSADVGGTGAPGTPEGRVGGLEGERGTADPAAILRPGNGVAEPVLVLRVEPTYPDLARRTRTEGLVVVEAVISGSGIVEEARVVHSAHPLLDAAAVRAVQQWRYRAATLHGRPVRVLLTVSVSFSLR